MLIDVCIFLGYSSHLLRANYEVNLNTAILRSQYFNLRHISDFNLRPISDRNLLGVNLIKVRILILHLSKYVL